MEMSIYHSKYQRFRQSICFMQLLDELVTLLLTLDHVSAGSASAKSSTFLSLVCPTSIHKSDQNFHPTPR